MGLFSSIGTALGSAFGGPIGGTIGTAIGSHLDTSSAQKAERAATDRANALSISQVNTGYQRAMADMKKAGLNPILAAKYGPAPVASIQRENILTPQMMTAEASMMQAHTAQQQSQSKIDLNNAQTNKLRAEIPKIAAEITRIYADAGLKNAMTAIPQLVSDLVESIRSLGGVANSEQLQKRIEDTVKVEVKKRKVPVDTTGDEWVLPDWMPFNFKYSKEREK
jgi:hypothetical protein